HRLFGEAVPDVTFDTSDPTTIQPAVRQLCTMRGDSTVIYAARARDLARFVVEIDRQKSNNVCTPRVITIAGGSDGSRIRAVDPDPIREQIRQKALNPNSFKDGYLRLVNPPLANPEALAAHLGTGFTTFKNQFTGDQRDRRFDETDLDDGWAINAHDALTAVAEAINTLPIQEDGAPQNFTATQVNTAIGAFTVGTAPVPNAAQSPLRFDNSGNRLGEPFVVQLCPNPGDPTRTRTVELFPDQGGCA